MIFFVYIDIFQIFIIYYSLDLLLTSLYEIKSLYHGSLLLYDIARMYPVIIYLHAYVFIKKQL